ncbi:hypothetical protein BH10ACT1_BH10ACT1_42510 [soil metagenome]
MTNATCSPSRPHPRPVASTRRTTTPTRDLRRRGVAVAATAAAMVLSLGSCSSTGRSDADRPPGASTTIARRTTTTGSTAVEPDPTTTTVVVRPDVEPVVEDLDLDAARARLEGINLTIDDLPEGWTADPPLEEVDTVVDQCTTNGDGVLVRAPSDRFSLIDGTGGLGLDTSSGYLDSEVTADALMGELGTEDFADCATEMLLTAEGVSFEGALAQVEEVPELGDDAVALQGDFAITDTEGTTAHLSAIVVAIRTDQVITTVTATAVNTPGDEPLLYEVLDLVAERQAD